MSMPFNAETCLKQFTGTAPLFPLPNAVLFPQLVLPLHIFEERYREMTADALASDRLISLALLRPGWEETYRSKQAPIYSTVCLGHVTAEEVLDDGGYNIIVRGLCRARVLDERPSDNAYRIARLQPLKDVYPDQSADCWEQCREALITAFQHRFPQLASNKELQRAVREDLSLGVLCDLLCSSLPLTPNESAEMLMEVDVRRRCRWLLQRLGGVDRQSTGELDFPPAFSVN